MHVLLATDGSDGARKATAWLRALPLPDDATIRVLAVAPLPHSPLDIPPVREFHQRLLDGARYEAESACAALRGRHPVDLRVAAGEPREVIVREATDWPADLVVVGARGLGPVGRFLLGSVSTAVVRGAPRAVAVVRGQPRQLRRVVVACDGSPDAFAAVQFVGALRLGRGVSVRLLGVVAPPPVPIAGPEVLAVPWPPPVDDFMRTEQASLDEVLARVETELGSEIGPVERSVVVGHPAAEILAAAEEPGVDLVVAGARGLGPLRRLVLGSVSERVLQHAPCPVLVVKGKAGP